MRVTCPECGQDLRMRRDAKASEDRCPVCGGVRPRPVHATSVPREDDADRGSVELKRTCPRCDERFPARLERCPTCGTNYREARGLDTPSKLELPLDHPLRGGRGGMIFLYLPYLGVRKILEAVRGLTKPRYDKDRRTRRRVGERRSRFRDRR